MSPFRIGIVGCGQIAAATAEAIAKSDRCTITCVMDSDPVAAEAMGGRWSVPHTTDLWALLERDDVDAVYVATPHATHAPVAVEAARAGKHVMVEKPMATDLRDAQMMIEACRQARVLLSVVMPSRYSWRFERLRDLVARGAVGEIVSTRILDIATKPEVYWNFGVGGRARRSAWRAFRGTAGGGILIMNTIHTLDALLYATGLSPARVLAMGGTYASPAAVEDAIAVLVGYDRGGAYGVIESMSCAHGGGRAAGGVWVYGTRGQIVLGRDRIEVYTTAEDVGLEAGAWQQLQGSDAGHARQRYVEEFAAAAEAGREPLVTAEEGLRVLRTILGAYRSAETGREVSLKGEGQDL